MCIVLLNSIYGGQILDIDRTCVHETAKDKFKSNADLIDAIRDKLATSCIAPDACNIIDPTDIRSRLNRCTVSIKCSSKFPARRVTKNSMKLAFTFAIQHAAIRDLHLLIGTHALHFHPGLNYLNWGDDICNHPQVLLLLLQQQPLLLLLLQHHLLVLLHHQV